ncbi:hypothetical protein BpHYR1_004527 [Brachionus plicatilis]|uniref:Uncharacterized protein n=1 Tax=Brachionus plicatilis TaxID=10195 RepID=A0A3M7SJJ1_BRAPC|nr:hypothetical protein BpHYR1_004527 [Brachionus plicatilis]
MASAPKRGAPTKVQRKRKQQETLSSQSKHRKTIESEITTANDSQSNNVCLICQVATNQNHLTCNTFI